MKSKLSDDKETSNFNGILNVEESDILRKDTKNLLWSLKKHQNAIKESLNKLKSKEEMNKFYPRRRDEYRDEHQYELEEEEELEDDQLEFKSNHKDKREYNSYNKSFNQPNQSKSKSPTKSVWFSDYLRTCGSGTNSNGISPRRRSRSASPNLANSLLANKIPSKSILKKRIVQENSTDSVCLDEETNEQISDLSSSLSSGSTNSLLCSDIYGGFKSSYGDTYDYNNLIHRNDYKNDCVDILFNSTNSNEFVDLIAKKRRSYLNHSYNDDCLSQTSLDEKTHSNEINKRCYSTDKTMTTKSRTSPNLRRSNSVDNNECQKQLSKSANQQSLKNKSEVRTSSNKMDTCNESISKSRTKNSNNHNNQTNNSNKFKMNKTRNYKKMAHQAKRNKPLLGFDWALDNIETKLNTTSSKYEKPEEYWEELSSFRNNFKQDCISNKPINFDGTITSFLENETSLRDLNKNKNLLESNFADEDGKNHKCIHSYTLNDRLFTVPVYKGKNGQSLCPVCKSSRQEPTYYSPKYCKISIPKSRIIESHRIPANNRSKDVSEDTLSLAENCVAGYQNAPKKGSNLYNMPKSKNLDLKSAMGLTNELAKLTIDDLKLIQQNKDPAFCDVYNKAHLMRYELEDQHLKRLKELVPKMSS